MSKIRNVVRQAQALGGVFAELVQPWVELDARGHSLSWELESLRRQEEAAFPDLVMRLARGELEPAKLPIHADSLGVWAFDSPASKVLVQASKAAHNLAERSVIEAAPLLFAATVPAVMAIVDESVSLVEQRIPRGVDSDAAAFKSRQPEVTEAWHQLRTRVDRWDALHGLHWLLMDADLLEGPANVFAGKAAAWTKYKDPTKLPPKYQQLAPELKLATAAARGAGPGVYPWPDAIARWKRLGGGA